MVVRSVDEPPRAERPDPRADGDPGSWNQRGPGWAIVACLAALAVPFVVALVGFRRDLWTPVLDLAMTELRVRDVGGRHTPLIGLPGRIGPLSEQGSHPGPLSFYALAPTYRLLGSSAWAMQVATAVVHLVAVGAALAIAGRRGGRELVVVVAVGLAMLTAGYGGGALTEPWNPYLPLVWWVVLLLAVWSVLCGDLPVLPVAVLAGSFCAQTHVPYLGLVLGLGALATAGAVWWWRQEPVDRRRGLAWIGGSVVLGVVLWVPPTLDQVRHDPGNYRSLIEHFTSPDEEPRGLGEGIEEGLRYLDLPHLLRADLADPGWSVTRDDRDHPVPSRGAAFLLVWSASAAVALRRGSRSLRALHLVVGAGIVLMVLAISRIFGTVWYYLTLWGWAIGILALAAVLATAVEVWGARSPDAARRGRPLALGALVVLGVVVLGRYAVDAWDSPHADAPVAAELASAIEDVEAGLDGGAGLSDGHDGRYLVTWTDPLHIGSQGYGLVSELERRGYDVGVEAGRRVPATAHRVLDRADATARIHLATGDLVERWRTMPGAVEIAYVDPRSGAERAEQERLRADVLRELERLGLQDLVDQLDGNLFGTAIDERIPEATQRQLGRMLDLGGPLAVFVVPVDAPDL